MEKKVQIGELELKVRSSLFTIIDYKNTFGTDLFKDVSRISNTEREEISLIIQILFQIIYTLHRPFCSLSFDEFLNNIDFSILNDAKALEDLSNVIGELLGSVKEKPKETP